MADDTIELRAPGIRVTLSSHGAEPQSITDADKHEYLWQAGPAWPRRAPVLFPVICRVPDDEIVVDGVRHQMPQHGFARDLVWDVVDVEQTRASFVLTSSERTVGHFPFDFALAATYEVHEATLVTTYLVENRGDRPMPYSLGSHPAFAWPLDPSHPRTLHEVRFSDPEPGPVRRVVDNLLTAETHPSLVVENRVELRDSLFEDGAVIMPDVASTWVTYAAAAGRGVRMSWEGFTGITLWTKPGAEFICVEPWRGLPARADFAGEFLHKPGNAVVPAGERHEYRYRLTLE